MWSVLLQLLHTFSLLNLNFLRSKWLTHQLNAIDRDELPNEIKGKTSVINIRTHCHFPFQSGGTELDVAATGCSLHVGSSCSYSSCQSGTGWVFGRTWTGSGHVWLNWDNCLWPFQKQGEECWGESGEVLCMGSCESLSSGMEICQCSSWPQWVQCVLWVTGDTLAVTCTENDTTDAFLFNTLAFSCEYAIYWRFLMLTLFNSVILWFLRKCFAGLHLINGFIQSGDPSRRLIIEFNTVAFDLRTAWRMVSN